MKINQIIVIFAGLIFSLPTFGNELNWPELTKLVEIYTENPTSENANHIIEKIPEKHISYKSDEAKSKALDLIYTSSPMVTLEKQVLKAEPTSVKLGIRMLNISDGAFTEDLIIIIGKLININPELFLKEITQAHIINYKITRNFGEEFVDKPERICEEISRRIESLKRVTVSELKAKKIEAINSLKQKKVFINSIFPLLCKDT